MRESANADTSTSLPLSVIERTSRAMRSMKVSAPSVAVKRTTVRRSEDLGALREVERDLVGLGVDDRAALLRFDAGQVLSRHCDAPVWVRGDCRGQALLAPTTTVPAYVLAAGILSSHMTSRVFDRGVEIGEEVLVMAQRIEHPDGPEELLVSRLHALDQHGDAAPLEGA